MSGDFNPDSVINNQKFGAYERKDNPEFVPSVEEPITKPIIKMYTALKQKEFT